MDIQVEGHNNRVAGRDYLELHAQLSLTPEQLKQLAIKPCAACEVRVVTANAQVCNHCLRAQAASALKTKIYVAIFCVIVVWGQLLQGREPHATPWQLLETLVGAIGMVTFGAVLLEIFRYWWACHSTDFFSALWRAITKRSKTDRWNKP